ncbi:MAG: polysaccharide deacetylase family protein [Anaerolineaceae bacterium]|nr:polysaccharide deacetylase family protein [Anaerolineaceae bacterium]
MQDTRAIITTSWDDGHLLDFKIADLLSKYELKGTFYIPSRINKSSLTKSQIRELAASFEIGAHTVNHVILTKLSNQDAKIEIEKSKINLEDIIGKSCNTFCFPSGKYGNRHVKMVQQAGFNGARTVELLSYRHPQKAQGIWLMPTTLQVFPHKPIDYLKNIAKRLSAENMSHYIKCYSPSWISIASSLIKETITQQGVFHLWGHSWEVQQENYWRNLEEVFSILHQFNDQALYLDNSEVCSRDKIN